MRALGLAAIAAVLGRVRGLNGSLPRPAIPAIPGFRLRGLGCFFRSVRACSPGALAFVAVVFGRTLGVRCLYKGRNHLGRHCMPLPVGHKTFGVLCAGV